MITKVLSNHVPCMEWQGKLEYVEIQLNVRHYLNQLLSKAEPKSGYESLSFTER